MPIGAITMILTNVGLQIYNNWCSSRQNARLQQKREEFERAARERNTQRMWQIMREGQELTKALEEDRHRQRIDELKTDIGSLLQKLAYTATINNWPLNVLPIVMKNQALGNILANQEESIALHCIFTPSNSNDFNKVAFPRIEETLEVYCNQNWSVMSDHPILFYSGAWKSQQSPTEVQIDSMRTALSNLPTLLITPFFRPNDGKLVFHVRIWGVGASSSDEFSIPEIEPTEFQRNYQADDDYVNDAQLIDELVEDIVPYLQCLIGYMADTYFWSAFGLAPCLPKLLVDGCVNTDGMKYLLVDTKDYFERLLKEEECSVIEHPFAETKALSLYDGIACFYQDNSKKSKLEEIFISYCSQHTAKDYHSMLECLDVNSFVKEDLPFIRKFCSFYKYNNYQTELKDILSVLEAVDFDYSILDATDITFLKELAYKGNRAAMFRLGEIYEYSIGIEKYDVEKSTQYYNMSLQRGFILAEIYSLIHDETTNKIGEFPKNKLLILNLLHKNGVVDASLFLSQYYYYGPIQEKEKVLSYIEEAPDTTQSGLFFWGGKILLDFYGKNELESVEYNFQKSAQLGYIKAMLFLMQNYQKGGLFSEQPKKAFEYAYQATRQGSVMALGKLGLFLYIGYGTYKNKNKGLEFIKLAAQKGDENSLEILKHI